MVILDSVKSTSEKFYASKYIFTISNPLIKECFSTKYPKLSKSVSSIKYFNAICVILRLRNQLSDYYWLNIADENSPFGGIIEHTNLVSPEQYGGEHIVYLSRYYTETDEISNLSDLQLKKIFLNYLPKVITDFNPETVIDVSVHRGYHAANKMSLNFSDLIPNFKTNLKRCHIANMCHVYPDERSVNNSIKVSISAVSNLKVKPHI